MDDLDFYRRQITLARIDADVAKTKLSSTQLNLKLLDTSLQAALRDNARLRAQVEYLEAQMQKLSARLEEVKSSFSQVPVEDLIKSLISAIESGSNWSENLTISNARADIRVAMQLGEGGMGILAVAPGVYPVEALSTISFELSHIPPHLSEEMQQSAVEVVRSAVLDLQSALDRILPDRFGGRASVAIARAGEFISAPDLYPGSAKSSIVGLISSLDLLSENLPGLRPQVKRLSEVYSGLPTSPSRQDLKVLARAISDIASYLQGET